MSRRLQHVALVTLVFMTTGVSPVTAKSSWTNAYEPPTTIDIIRVKQDASGAPNPTGSSCQVTARYNSYDFRTYVKEVLPNEWYSTWPSDSLRAGAEAVKEYGWWATMNTSYSLCASTNNADVTDSTDDQIWIPGFSVCQLVTRASPTGSILSPSTRKISCGLASE